MTVTHVMKKKHKCPCCNKITTWHRKVSSDSEGSKCFEYKCVVCKAEWIKRSGVYTILSHGPAEGEAI